MQSKEFMLLKSWHLKLLIIGAMLTPAITATGAYYGVRIKMVEDQKEVSDRVNKLELDTAKTFAEKSSLQNLDGRMQRMENDITEIKTILKTRLR